MNQFSIAAVLIVLAAGSADAQVNPNVFMGNLKGLGNTLKLLAHGPGASADGSSATGNQPARTVNPVSGSGAAAVGMLPSDIETSSTADSQMASAPVRPGVVTSFDVMGLKLGMTIKEARRVAEAKHLRPNGFVTGYDFDTQVRAKMASPSGNYEVHNIVNYATPRTDDGGSMAVHFQAEPDGAHVSEVWYKSGSHGRKPQEILDAMVARYGKPTTLQADPSFVSAQWCESGRPNVYCGSAEANLRFTANTDDFQLTLEQGVKRSMAHEQSVADRAHAIQRANSPGVSF